MFNFKKAILKYFPIDKFLSKSSYSQEGEDMVLNGYFENNKGYKGFFVDIGAHHPYRYSNTMFFYKKGWRGINIEPTPGAISAFKRFRGGDVNLNIGISKVKDALTFYCFNEPALNGFSKEMSEARNATSAKYNIIKEVQIQTLPLADVLDQYVPAGKKIDFFTIDVEGFDLQVLQSNNWGKYKPTFILVEDAVDFTNLGASEIYQYLEKQGYQMVAKTMRTLFFKIN
jgi:FkbM family methyltransferase